MARMAVIEVDSEEELKTRCQKMVPYSDFHSHRCSRKAVKDGYCKQHHPEAERARREKSDRERKAKWDNSPVMQLKRMLQAEKDRLFLRLEMSKTKLQEAFEYANGRWSEWGSRAEGTVELLEELERILKGETGE